MQLNEQALLNTVLTGVVLSGQLGYRVPKWAQLVSVLALSMSLAYSLASIAKPIDLSGQ